MQRVNIFGSKAQLCGHRKASIFNSQLGLERRLGLKQRLHMNARMCRVSAINQSVTPSYRGAKDKAAIDVDDKEKRVFKLASALISIPHPQKIEKGGEDASFISENGYSVGVADGVGGWTDSGVDAGLFSKALMKYAEDAAMDTKPCVEAPLRILESAHKGVVKQEILGSCTACVAVLDNNTLHIANLGDSGAMVVRGDKVIHQTPPQQHRFNFPFQLTASTQKGLDQPSDAQRWMVDVEEDDLIMIATDGVFDNLYPTDIVELMQPASHGGSLRTCAYSIAAMAHDLGSNTQYASPFCLAAAQQSLFFMGGKLDDVTVVVCRVKPVKDQAVDGSVRAVKGKGKGIPSAILRNGTGMPQKRSKL